MKDDDDTDDQWMKDLQARIGEDFGRMGLYIIDPATKEAMQTSDIVAWGEAFEKIESRQVDFTRLGSYSVSTVFLGVDHAFIGRRRLFETMVFKHDVRRRRHWQRANEGTYRGVHIPYPWRYELGVQQRYSTWADAATGHDLLVRRVASMRAAHKFTEREL